jgi:hypothetical protein
MVNTPIWENSEEFWAYRAIEKTIADFRNLGTSSDLGVTLKGYVDGDHRIGYAALVGDGQGQRPENDRFKKFYVSLPLRLGDLRIEPYADYQSMRVNLLPHVPSNTDSLAVNNDQATWKVFAGYEFRRFALGAEGVLRVNHRAAGAPNQEPRGLSLFAPHQRDAHARRLRARRFLGRGRAHAEPRRQPALDRGTRLAAVQGRAPDAERRSDGVHRQGHGGTAAALRRPGPRDALLEVRQTSIMRTEAITMIRTHAARIAVMAAFAASLVTAATVEAQNLTGAGATFPYPIYRSGSTSTTRRPASRSTTSRSAAAPESSR